MKKIVVIFFALALALGASAQKYYRGGYVRPRVSIGIGTYLPLYPGYGYYSPFYAYPPSYGYGYYPHRYTKLDMQIQDIKNDYSDRIWSAKHDKSLTRHQRKEKVHELKHERDDAITQAKRNYYKTK